MMNQRIIEIVGPPGIGKSTVYKSLCKTWTPELNWIHQEALFNGTKPHILYLTQWIRYQLRKLASKKPSKSLSVDFGLRFADAHKELASYCWSHISDSRVYNDNLISQRFRAAYFLFADFCRYQAILEKNCDKPCIINEGLLQKSFFLLDNRELMRETLLNYLSLLPLPKAIFCINTQNKGMILERLRNRKKVIASHVDKSNEDLARNIELWDYQLNLILKTAYDRNVPVYHLDGEKPVTENVRLIRNILKEPSSYRNLHPTPSIAN